MYKKKSYSWKELEKRFISRMKYNRNEDKIRKYIIDFGKQNNIHISINNCERKMGYDIIMRNDIKEYRFYSDQFGIVGFNYIKIMMDKGKILLEAKKF